MKLHRDIDACARSLRGEMVEFTRELVAVPSENPPGRAYPECLRTIASRLRALGLPFDQVPYQPPKGTADNAGAAVVVTGIGHVIAALIEDAGARVDSVASAAEGRRQLRAHNYSALVSDLAMPYEDGYSFMQVNETMCRPLVSCRHPSSRSSPT